VIFIALLYYCHSLPLHAPEFDVDNVQANSQFFTGLGPQLAVTNPQKTAVFVAQGACVDDADKEAMAKEGTKLQGDVQNCAFKCIISGTSCMTKCVEGLGLSAGCSGCFVDLATCSKSKCALSCLGGPKSSSCQKCAKDKCFPGLVSCAGVTPPTPIHVVLVPDNIRVPL